MVLVVMVCWFLRLEVVFVITFFWFLSGLLALGAVVLCCLCGVSGCVVCVGGIFLGAA